MVCDTDMLEPRQADACKELCRQPTLLLAAFFSRANIARLQRDIKEQIGRRMGYGIEDQSEDVLWQVMVRVYEWYSTMSDLRIPEQIDALNSEVLKVVLPNIAVNIKQDLHYKRTLAGPSTQLPLPQISSRKGTQTMPTFRGF